MFIVRFQHRGLLRLRRVFFALPQNGRPLLSLTVWLTPQAALSQDGCLLRMISRGQGQGKWLPQALGSRDWGVAGECGEQQGEDIGG